MVGIAAAVIRIVLILVGLYFLCWLFNISGIRKSTPVEKTADKLKHRKQQLEDTENMIEMTEETTKVTKSLKERAKELGVKERTLEEIEFDG